MNSPLAQLFVFVSGDLACVKIVGRANFTTSIDFRTLIDELEKKGFTCYILDLTECVMMDSTFLGGLAGLALKAKEAPNGNGHPHMLELLNPNERNLESLENVGVLNLFKVVNGPNPLPGELLLHRSTPGAKPSREEVTRNCLEAHKLLMEISPANIPKFKEVTQFLAEDLKKLKPGE